MTPEEPSCAYDLVVAGVFQNEAPYLKEWIEFHKMIGVQRFVLVNDRSTDDFMDVLQPYIKAREVDLLSNPCPDELLGKRWKGYHAATLRSLCRQLRGVTRWLAMIDIDEFIVPMEKDSLVELLADHEQYGAIHIRWEVFGTSHVERVLADELLTERLTLKARFRKGEDMLGKSIVKPHRVHDVDIHRCELLPGYEYIDSNPGMEYESTSIKINHYWTRDEHFLCNEKLPRTSRNRGWVADDKLIAHFKETNNDVSDRSMERFLPELRRRVLGAQVARAVRP